jgi:hypothetical protein
MFIGTEKLVRVHTIRDRGSVVVRQHEHFENVAVGMHLFTE